MFTVSGGLENLEGFKIDWIVMFGLENLKINPPEIQKNPSFVCDSILSRFHSCSECMKTTIKIAVTCNLHFLFDYKTMKQGSSCESYSLYLTKKSASFYRFWSLITCLRVSAIGPYLASGESSPCPHTFFFKVHFIIIIHVRQALQVVTFLQAL
jgi:hypothetical protein